jgi:hypothetical protein
MLFVPGQQFERAAAGRVMSGTPVRTERVSLLI